jgi:drug/metabolite transporter (DMT)-like permease
MPCSRPLISQQPIARWICACGLMAIVFVTAHPASAQQRDGLGNGAVIGAAIGAGAGVAFTHAVRDSDLTFSQYLRGAVIFGAIGAGAGLAIDALFSRAATPSGVAPRRIVLAPALSRQVRGVTVSWRW